MPDTPTPILVATCESVAAGGRSRPHEPHDGQSWALFPIHDPFGVRKAVFPLFWADAEGDLQGYGTAFAVDPWGCLLTADHVIADMRRGARHERQADGGMLIHGPADAGFVAVLGYGVIFGTVGLPQEAIAPVMGAWSLGLEGDDPLATLQGRPDLRPIDVAILRARVAASDWVHCLPFRAPPPPPRIGETVIAFGFPQIDTFRGDQEAVRTTIEEGMCAAYGRVTKLLPQGRDRANPTPVFEVEANWPSGMSGGPVLNESGEIIGLVSRSLAPEGGASAGTGWATWLQALAPFPSWAPTLDDCNPTWRRGWALVRDHPWRIDAVFPTESAADAMLKRAPSGAEVRKGVWRLGTDDFITA